MRQPGHGRGWVESGATSHPADPSTRQRARMTTVLETLDKGTAYLAKKGIEDARRNM